MLDEKNFGVESLSSLNLKYGVEGKVITVDDVLLIEKALSCYSLDLGEYKNNKSLDANLEALESHAIKYRVNELKDAINNYSNFLGETYDRLVNGGMLATDTYY